jgi:hypothetical protein
MAYIQPCIIKNSIFVKNNKDDDFPNYCDFEDYSWKLFNKLIEKWKKII